MTLPDLKGINPLTRVEAALPDWWVDVTSRPFGAVGDVRQVFDGVVNGTSTVTSATAAFTADDVGKKIDINQSGATANDDLGFTGFNNQVGTILTYVNATTITVSFTAVRTTTGLQITFGTDDTAAIIAAVAAGDYIYFPPGNYCVSAMAVDARSGQVFAGAGQKISILTQIGPIRNPSSAIFFPTFRIWDGVSNVLIRDLSIVGTNRGTVDGGQRPTTYSHGYSKGIYMGTGSGGAISYITVRDCDLSHMWGMGFRNDGDVGDQATATPTIHNVKLLRLDVINNGDNGLNPHIGGGLEVAHCFIDGNGAGGIENGGSKILFHDNFVSYNRLVGCAVGGTGDINAGFGETRDHVWTNNIIFRNGTAGASGSGMQIGINVVHAVISNNIIRENNYQGVGFSDTDPDFASRSRHIRFVNNKVISNGLTAGSGKFGIAVGIAGVIIEGNDIYDDGAPNYSQTQGIIVSAPNCQIIRNHVYNHSFRDYNFGARAINTTFIDEYAASVIAIDTTAFSGTVDTSGTAVTWKTGDLFSIYMKAGATIKINSVDYPIASVAAAPSGTVNTSGAAITRVTGPSFTSAWVGKYITINTVNYIIASVADADNLTVTISYGSPGVQTGVAWALRDGTLGSGAVTLTLATSAGSQSAVAYVVAPNFVKLAPLALWARVYHNTTQALTTAVQAALAFNSERWDTDTIHDTATNNTRLTCKTAGVYDIKAQVEFESNSTGHRQVDIRLNGTTALLSQIFPAINGNVTRVNVATSYRLALNDYVECLALQDSGGNLNVQSTAQVSPEFTMELIGS